MWCETRAKMADRPKPSSSKQNSRKGPYSGASRWTKRRKHIKESLSTLHPERFSQIDGNDEITPPTTALHSPSVEVVGNDALIETATCSAESQGCHGVLNANNAFNPSDDALTDVGTTETIEFELTGESELGGDDCDADQPEQDTHHAHG